MAGRSNRSRRRRRARSKMNSEAADHSSPPRSSGCYLQVTEEKPDLRMPRDPRAVRSFLLGRIRGYYIDVISRLPAGELRTSIARGLLVGGHCYGPLHSVHNIIFNSVWYAAAFPFRGDDPIDVDVITTTALTRLAHRSPTTTPSGTSASPTPPSVAPPLPPRTGLCRSAAWNWKQIRSRWLPRRRGTRNLPPLRTSLPRCCQLWSAMRCLCSPASAGSRRKTLCASPPCCNLSRCQMMKCSGRSLILAS